MKIIEKNKAVAKDEAKEKAIVEIESKEREETLKRFHEDAMMQKYIVQEILQAELAKITDLRWMYEAQNIGSSSDSTIGKIMRQNSVVYRSLKNLLKPLMK